MYSNLEVGFLLHVRSQGCIACKNKINFMYVLQLLGWVSMASKKSSIYYM